MESTEPVNLSSTTCALRLCGNMCFGLIQMKGLLCILLKSIAALLNYTKLLLIFKKSPACKPDFASSGVSPLQAQGCPHRLDPSAVASHAAVVCQDARQGPRVTVHVIAGHLGKSHHGGQLRDPGCIFSEPSVGQECSGHFGKGSESKNDIL